MTGDSAFVQMQFNRLKDWKVKTIETKKANSE